MGKLRRWNGTLKGMYGYQQFCLKLEGGGEGGGAGYVKALLSANVLIEGLGLACIFKV